MSTRDFLGQLANVIDAAYFGLSFQAGDLLYKDGKWWRLDGRYQLAPTCEPKEVLLDMLIANSAKEHPFCAVRHSDYCKHEPCTCPPEVREREARRRAADPLLRAVDEARREKP